MSLEPLGGLDAAFLSFDTTSAQLHLGLVVVVEPPGDAPSADPTGRFSRIRQTVEQRLPLVPRLRQRAMPIPYGLHLPVWADDPDFDLSDHLSRASLPAPGGPRQLDDMVAGLMGRPLHPDRPLWEMVVVDGLAGARTAIVVKVHHALLDGASGAEILGSFLDLGPDTPPVPAEPAWSPGPLPSRYGLLRHAAEALVRQPQQAFAAVTRSAEALVEVTARNRSLIREGRRPPPALFGAPRTSLNGTISPRRRFSSLVVPVAEAAVVRRSFGTTQNDVVLTVVAGGLRRLLAERGDEPRRPLVAMVPVSARRSRNRAEAGNRLSAMLVSLATDRDDPSERLLAVAESARLAKAQDRVVGSDFLEGVARATPPPLLSRLARWSTSLALFDHVPPPFNVTISSVRGPGAPLWFAGGQVTALYPIGPVAAGCGLNVTVMSYREGLHIGLLGCRRLVPDIDRLAGHVAVSMHELLAAARARSPLKGEPEAPGRAPGPPPGSVGG